MSMTAYGIAWLRNEMDIGDVTDDGEYVLVGLDRGPVLAEAGGDPVEPRRDWVTLHFRSPRAVMVEFSLSVDAGRPADVRSCDS